MVRDGILGSVVKIEYLLKEAIAVFPDVLPDYTLDGLIQLNDGYDWTELEIVQQSSSLRATFLADDRGERFILAIPAVKSRIESAASELYRQLRHSKFILRVTDANEKVYIVGNENEYVDIEYNLGTGGSPEARSGYTLTFKMNTSEIPPYNETNTLPAGLSWNGALLVHKTKYLTDA